MASAAASVVGQVVGGAAGAAAGPWAIAADAVSSLAKPLLDLIPDPAAKQQAQQQIAEQQYQLAMAQVQAQQAEMQAASENVQSDRHMSAARAFFCFGMSCLYFWNYAGVRLIHGTPFELPTQIHWMFAVMMLGLVGIPSTLDTLQSIMGMPGNSSVSFLGANVSNKP